MPDRLTKSTDYVREAPYKPLPIAPQNCVAWVKRELLKPSPLMGEGLDGGDRR